MIMINPKTAAKQFLRKQENRTAKNAVKNKVNHSVSFIGSVGSWDRTRNLFFIGRNPYYHVGKNADKRIARETAYCLAKEKEKEDRKKSTIIGSKH